MDRELQTMYEDEFDAAIYQATVAGTLQGHAEEAADEWRGDRDRLVRDLDRPVNEVANALVTNAICAVCDPFHQGFVGKFNKFEGTNGFISSKGVIDEDFKNEMRSMSGGVKMPNVTNAVDYFCEIGGGMDSQEDGNK